MPPKKKDADDDAVSGEGAWKWTPENDRALFLLILGRSTLGRDDWEKIATALSPNVNWNGVRQRVSKFRGEQKKLFEELGWDVAAETPAKGGKAPATPRKRKGGGEGEETPSKVKKGRAGKGGKGGKSEEVVEGEEDEEGGEMGVKEEEEESV